MSITKTASGSALWTGTSERKERSQGAVNENLEREDNLKKEKVRPQLERTTAKEKREKM